MGEAPQRELRSLNPAYSHFVPLRSTVTHTPRLKVFEWELSNLTTCPVQIVGTGTNDEHPCLMRPAIKADIDNLSNGPLIVSSLYNGQVSPLKAGNGRVVLGGAVWHVYIFHVLGDILVQTTDFIQSCCVQNG